MFTIKNGSKQIQMSYLSLASFSMIFLAMMDCITNVATGKKG